MLSAHTRGLSSVLFARVANLYPVLAVLCVGLAFHSTPITTVTIAIQFSVT